MMKLDSQVIRLLAKAYDFACKKHQSQRRKGGLRIPYINHPIQVCKILTECSVYHPYILCSSILHDTIEDTNTTPQQIQFQFNSEIKNYVLECTDQNQFNDIVTVKKLQIQKSKTISDGAKFIKIADKISNNQDLLKQIPQKWSIQRKYGYHIWSEAVFNNLKQSGNIELNNRMNKIFEEIGIDKLSKKQKQKQLNKYYQILEIECK